MHGPLNLSISNWCGDGCLVRATPEGGAYTNHGGRRDTFYEMIIASKISLKGVASVAN